jgi:hypothetical protein
MGSGADGDERMGLHPTFRGSLGKFASCPWARRISSAEETTMPGPDRSEVLDHLGLVAAMFEELGIGEVIEHATQQTPATRLVTAGSAVKAMVLNGLSFVNQQRSLVPMFFHNKATQRLVTLGIKSAHLNDDA